MWSIRESLSDEDSERAIRVWTRLGVERFPLRGLVARICALRDDVSAYDTAACVAFAEALDCSPLTPDSPPPSAPTAQSS